MELQSSPQATPSGVAPHPDLAALGHPALQGGEAGGATTWRALVFLLVMTLDTVALVNDHLAADLERAFPELMREMEGAIYSGVRRMFPTGADAEDITQEVFIRAYRALAEYPPERIRQLSLRGWVWTIAMNLCRNAARTRSRRPRTVELDRDAFGSNPGPEAHVLMADENHRWAELLSRLPSAQRNAVILRHVVGLPYTDIAQATGRPEGTVKADVHRGIATLKEALT